MWIKTKHIKICATSLTMKKVHIGTLMRYHCMLIRMEKINLYLEIAKILKCQFLGRMQSLWDSHPLVAGMQKSIAVSEVPYFVICYLQF